MSSEIAPGSRVMLHISLTLLDGSEALSTFDDEAMTFVIGDKTLPEGLELALYGLREGGEQVLQLTPEQAYGAYDESKIHLIPRKDFPHDTTLEPDQVVQFNVGPDEETLGTVLDLRKDLVRVDFNHPLAGRDIIFKALILAIE